MVVGCGVLLGIGFTSSSSAAVPTGSQASALIAKRTQLMQQLAALEPARDSASNSLSRAEQAFAAAQSQLLAEQQQQASLNARLSALSGQIADDEATIAKAKQQLAVLTRQSYESTSTDSWVAAVLSASTFSQAVDRLTGASHVAEQVRNMQDTLRTKEQAITQEQAEIKTDTARGTALEQQLARDSAALLVIVEQRNAVYQTASGPARAIAVQIAAIDQQLAGNSPGGSGCGNYTYGTCVWYVATRRCMPGLGNAMNWFYMAGVYGWPEGHTPAVGAVVVFPPGGQGAGPVGHVAYVEAVGPAANVPAGYFLISEMNYYGNGGGWDRVSYRLIADNAPGITGFIYVR